MRALLVAMLVLGVVTTAQAEDVPKAQAAYRAGTNHYDLGEYKEALDSFKEAYRNREDPGLLFNIAQCHRQLGDKLAAIRAYRTYLIKVPNASKREQIREMVAKLEQQLAEEQSAKTGPPQGTLKPAEPAPVSATPVVPPPSTPAPQEPAPQASPPAPDPAPQVVATPTETPPTSPKPLYKKWWLWTIVGGVVVVGVGVGLGVGLPRTPKATTDFGTFNF